MNRTWQTVESGAERRRQPCPYNVSDDAASVRNERFRSNHSSGDARPVNGLMSTFTSRTSHRSRTGRGRTRELQIAILRSGICVV